MSSPASKNFRRDKLMRLAKEGKLVCISSYRYEDGEGESRTTATYPVVLVEKMGDGKEGFVTLTPWHFKTKSGCAYQNGDVITLIVHSNSNFDFKVTK